MRSGQRDKLIITIHDYKYKLICINLIYTKYV